LLIIQKITTNKKFVTKIYFPKLKDMYSSYVAKQFSTEICRILDKSNFSIELLIGAEDLIKISKNLFEILNNKIFVSIIVNLGTHKKSVRLFNIVNRLNDCGAEVYWNYDIKVYKLKSHFLIIDKTHLLNKIYFTDLDDPRKQIFYFLSIYQEIKEESHKFNSETNNIDVEFEANEHIIKKNHKVKLSWKIKNALHIKIQPYVGEVESHGNTEIQLSKDTLFNLTVKNNKYNLSKFLFVKVFTHDEFNFDVSVFDPLIKENVFLNPVYKNGIETYVCYYGQKINISWDSDLKIYVSERNIITSEKKKTISKIIKRNFQIDFFDSENKKRIIKRIKIVSIKDLKMKNLIDESNDLNKNYFSKIIDKIRV